MADLEALEVGNSLTQEDEGKAESPDWIKTEWWWNLDGDCDPLEPAGAAILTSNPRVNTEIPLHFLQELGLMQE